MGSFQKILLLIALSITLSLAKKKRHSTVEVDSGPFGADYDILMNPSFKNFEEGIDKSNHLMFLYVFDSKSDKSSQMNEQILKPVMDELKGYLKFYAFDCQNEEVQNNKDRFKMCENEEHTPFFQLIKPPELKINPYTKQPMQAQHIAYPEREVTQQKVKNFILSNIPDFSTVIDSKSKLEDFKSDDDKDINKVILFSKKSKVAPIYKALTDEFRDLIRFGFISSDQNDLIKSFNVTKYPTVMVFKSYDVD